MIEASYHHIPCKINTKNLEIKGNNIFFEYLLRVMVHFDKNIKCEKHLPIYIKSKNKKGS